MGIPQQMLSEPNVPAFTPKTVKATSFNLKGGVDERLILKMFRSMGSLRGVAESDIQEALLSLGNSRVRAYLEEHLHDIFSNADADQNGVLTLKEFEWMVGNSTMMQEALYEINCLAADLRVFGARNFDGEVWLQRIITVVIVLNIILTMVSTDLAPHWFGWLWVEACFVAIFLLEIPIAVFYSARHSLAWPNPGMAKKLVFVWQGFQRHLRDPMNLFDMGIALAAALGVLANFMPVPNAANLTLLRILRLARLARVARLVRGSKELQLFLSGLGSGLRTVMNSLLLLALLCFLFSIGLRQNLNSSEGSPLNEIFPNVPAAMVVIGRCMVLRSEGACLDINNVPLYTTLSDEMGLAFQIPWLLGEAFVILGVLNMVSAIFVTNTIKQEQQLEHTRLLNYDIEQATMLRLETLLRSLIHPKRKGDMYQRNAANVVSIVQNQYPEIATKMPDLAKSMSQFAIDIQKSKEQYTSAMNQYNADETTECVQLRLIPSAKTFYVTEENSQGIAERLCVEGGGDRFKQILRTDTNSSIDSTSGGFNLAFAPADACEAPCLQQQGSISELLEEAAEVMFFMKSKILPGSDWASQLKAGKSPEAIWDESNHLCDQAVDPGPKGPQRAREKVEGKYKGMCEKNRDYARLGLIYNSVSHLLKAFKDLLKYNVDVDGIEVCEVENRYAAPTALGWQDLTLYLKVRVPSSGRYHVMEMQLQLRRMVQVREATAHKFYSNIRSVLPEDVLSRIIDQLTTNDSLDLNMTEKEWLSCLQNPHVTALLDELEIPRYDWVGMVETLDTDGSGSISTTELREGLKLCKAPVRTRDIIAIKLKVEHLSAFFDARLDKQLHEVQTMLFENTQGLMTQLHNMIAGNEGVDKQTPRVWHNL